jgi:hypothetical protein
MPYNDKEAATGLSRWLGKAENANWTLPENWAKAPEQLRRAVESLPDDRVMQVGRNPISSGSSTAKAYAAMGNQGPEVIKRLNGATEHTRLQKLFADYPFLAKARTVRSDSGVGPLVRQERLSPITDIDAVRPALNEAAITEGKKLPRNLHAFLAARIQQGNRTPNQLVFPPFQRGRHSFIPTDTQLRNAGLDQHGNVKTFDPMLLRLLAGTYRDTKPATVLQPLTGRKGFQPPRSVAVNNSASAWPIGKENLWKVFREAGRPAPPAQVRPPKRAIRAPDQEKRSATRRGIAGLAGLAGLAGAGGLGSGLYLGGDFKGDPEVSRWDYLKTRAALAQGMARLRTDKGWLSDVEMDTGLHRIVMPKGWINEKALKHMPDKRDWVKTLIAVPEKGQDTPYTWRQRGTGGHLHRHPNSWVLHRDRHEAMNMKLRDAKNVKEVLNAVGEGSKHLLGEGVPGLINFVDTMTTGGESIPARAGLAGPREDQWVKDIYHKAKP